MRRCGRRLWRIAAREEGGVAIEFAIVSVAFVLFSIGTLEFGRAFAVRNKLALVADMASREILKDSSVTEEEVETRIRDAFDARHPELLEVVLGTETVNGIPFRTISVRYPFVLLIPQLARESIVLSTTERVPVT